MKGTLFTCALILLALPVAACAHEDAHGTADEHAGTAISQYNADRHENLVRGARWQIVIHSGPGIPGSPGAQDYYREPERVLQSIVDTCQLGMTVYATATDGVSVLTIANDDLSEDQIACVRSAEDTGLYLSDRGVSQ